VKIDVNNPVKVGLEFDNLHEVVDALQEAGYEIWIPAVGSEEPYLFQYRPPTGLWTRVSEGDTVPSIIGVE
jgi:frataxin-like iron-binding protein CyaY